MNLQDNANIEYIFGLIERKQIDSFLVWLEETSHTAYWRMSVVIPGIDEPEHFHSSTLSFLLEHAAEHYKEQEPIQ